MNAAKIHENQVIVNSDRKREKCVFVTVEAPWPVINGGRARASHIILELAATHDVTVIYPGRPGEAPLTPPPGVHVIPSIHPARVKLLDRMGLMPRLGRVWLRAMQPDLIDAIASTGPQFIYWSHSYLAAVGMKKIKNLTHLVEFANIENLRSLSICRSSVRLGNKVSALVEYAKGLWWEPRCARRADLAISLHPEEARLLSKYGAKVELVPNGFSSRPFVPSPRESRTLLTLASWLYEPNKIAIESFLRSVWPEIIRRQPEMKLVIVGTGSDRLLGGRASGMPGITVVGFREDVTSLFNECFAFLAPASSGGGSQLKVAEGLSRHRVVVGPRFLVREMTREMPSGALQPSGRLADTIIDLAVDVERRHSIENQICSFVQDRSWSRNFLSVKGWLSEYAGRRAGI